MATALTRQRSFPSLPSLRREVDRLFGEFLPAELGEEEEEARLSAVWAPRLDVSETDHEYLVKMDLPGLNKEDITVSVEDHRLSVSGERKEEKKEEKENFLRMERSYGRFYRSIPLPKAAREKDVKAQFQNGVLTIHIPKAEEAKPRRIEIS